MAGLVEFPLVTKPVSWHFGGSSRTLRLLPFALVGMAGPLRNDHLQLALDQKAESQAYGVYG